jgi:hypothetical protein
MKQTDIVKIIAADFKTKNVDELNKLLKAKDAPSIRYRVSGKKVGHLGFTGTIKVTLIKFTDIEKFEKAKPKVARPEKPKAAAEEKVATKSKAAPAKATATKTAAPVKKATITKATEAKAKKVDNDDDDWEDHSPKAFGSEKFRPRAGKGGSNFIPHPKKNK